MKYSSREQCCFLYQSPEMKIRWEEAVWDRGAICRCRDVVSRFERRKVRFQGGVGIPSASAIGR